MPSAFEQQFAVQAPQLRDNFGETGVTYTAPDGVTVVSSLTVRIQREPVRQVDRNVKIQGELQTADIIVLIADLPNPVPNGRFAVGIHVWTIQMTPLEQNGEFICTCSRNSTNRFIPRSARE